MKEREKDEWGTYVLICVVVIVANVCTLMFYGDSLATSFLVSLMQSAFPLLVGLTQIKKTWVVAAMIIAITAIVPNIIVLRAMGSGFYESISIGFTQWLIMTFSGTLTFVGIGCLKVPPKWFKRF